MPAKHKKIFPSFTNHIGGLYLFISTTSSEFADYIEEEYYSVFLRRDYERRPNLPRIMISDNNGDTLSKIISDTIKRGYDWYLEYAEDGVDMDTHQFVSFNEHKFTTLEDFNAFREKYYDNAELTRMKEWWGCRSGEPRKITTDDTIKDASYCADCQRLAIIDCIYKNDDGIESYTPVFSCPLKGKKCRPKPYPSEDK